MWDCPMPDPDRQAAGFPILEGASHVVVFAPDRQAGAYNHHPHLVHHDGAYHAVWSNHNDGEDGPGQRILYATSTDGTRWTDPSELFPSPVPMAGGDDRGLALTAHGLLVLDSRLYAVAGCHANVGFENPDRTERSDVRDRDHPFRARRMYDRYCREIVPPSPERAPIFPLGPDVPHPGEIGFEALHWNDANVQATAERINDELRRPEGYPSWGAPQPQGVDTDRLCEPTVYRTADGAFLMLLRDDNYSHRLYAATSPDGNAYGTAVPTDIPDSPSLTTNAVLPDGAVLLIGNQIAPGFDNREEIRHYPRDPLTVAVSQDGGFTFSRVFALRRDAPELRVAGVRGRGPGFQYPSAVVHGEQLSVLYSIGKEDIAISHVPLRNLGLPASSGARHEES
jgi:hypothetical protein